MLTGRHQLSQLRVLCIGNEGLGYRDGQWWTYPSTAAFVAELGQHVREACWCAWCDGDDDPLKSTSLHDLPRVRAVSLPPLRGPVPTRLLNASGALARLVREVSRADVVYLYWPGRLSALAAALCRAVGTPYGIYLRGEEGSSGRAFTTTLRHARFVLAAGQALHAAASAVCHDVEQVTPMTALRPGHVRPPRLHRQPGPWRLLYVGRIDERKGVHDLLAAVSQLEAWHLPFTLTLVGHCADPAGLLRHVPEAVAQRVHLIGTVSDVDTLVRLYGEADAFVLASHDEGFPRVLYEAMASGVPILTTFVGGIAGVMQDHENCLRLAPQDPQAIAGTIRYLFEHPELHTQLARSGHRCITALMKTWTRSHAEQVADRLRDAVGQRA